MTTATWEAGVSEAEFLRVLEIVHVRLYRYARFVLEPEDAADLAAEAVEQIWRRRTSFDDERGDLAAWMTAVGRTRMRDLLRRRRRGVSTVSLDDVDVAGATAATSDRLLDLRAAMARLEPDDAELLAQRYALEMSLDEIAQSSGRSYGAVATAVYRAIRRLRALMEAEKVAS